jgi:hypothetical protein
MLTDCPWCPARLSALPVRRGAVVVVEFTDDAWDHLSGHGYGGRPVCAT